MDEAATDLVDRFHELEQEMCEVSTELRSLGIDPYKYIPEEDETDSESVS